MGVPEPLEVLLGLITVGQNLNRLKHGAANQAKLLTGRSPDLLCEDGSEVARRRGVLPTRTNLLRQRAAKRPGVFSKVQAGPLGLPKTFPTLMLPSILPKNNSVI